MGKYDWLWAVGLAGGGVVFFWKDICTAAKLGSCPTEWISDSLMNWIQSLQAQTPTSSSSPNLSMISPQAQAPTGVPTPPPGSISYDPVQKKYIPPNPGGTSKSCAGLTGATCVACCQTKGLSNCDCSQARYARSYAVRGRVPHYRKMRSSNRMRAQPAQMQRYRKIPTILG